MSHTTTNVVAPAEGPAVPPHHPADDGHGRRNRAARALRGIAARAGRVTAVAAVTVALGVGVATPASAAPAQTAGMTLTIHKPSNFNGSYKVYVSGVFPMSQAEAQRHIADLGNGGVEYDFFADDEGVGDSMFTHGVVRGASLPAAKPDRYLYAGPDGLRFFYSLMLDSRSLNEDNGWFDKTDEIYVRAWFVDRNNYPWWGSTSNVVIGTF